MNSFPAVRGYIRYLRDRAIGADALPDEAARASRARLIKAQAEAQEMENAKRGELVHVDDAADIVERIIETIRPKLWTWLPDKSPKSRAVARSPRTRLSSMALPTKCSKTSHQSTPEGLEGLRVAVRNHLRWSSRPRL